MKFDISIAVPGIPFSGETFDKSSIGGSESAGYYMAKALGDLGHRVTVFTNTDRPSRQGEVYYLPLSLFKQYVEFTPHDVLIAQRAPELLATPHSARFAALWCHDLAMARQGDKVRGVAWNYDKVFLLSDFHVQQYKEVYGLHDELIVKTRNGVDLATVEASKQALRNRIARSGSPVVDIIRDPFAICYSARPERGLDVLLSQIMPRILELEPRAHLLLSSYKNPVEHLAEFYDACGVLAQNLGDRVKFIGNLTKRQLYEVYLQSGVYAYPLPSRIAPEFDEISCISFMEAQACGLPVVSSHRGALPETLDPEAGILIREPVHTPEYYDAFARAVVKLMRNQDQWQKASAAGVARAASLDWKGVAEEWSELFEREIRARSSNPLALANHFWRRSDIYAAKAVIEKAKESEQPESVRKGLEIVEKNIQAGWGFLDEEDGFRKQYERIGATHDKRVIHASRQESRYSALKMWLEQNNGVRTVLDYGCAHGGYAINLLKDLPYLRITGVDIDSHGIVMATDYAKEFGVQDRWAGRVATFEQLDDPDVEEFHRQYDCVMAQEVLEHLAEPWEALKKLEVQVKDGGFVYITVPFGPWEYMDYKNYPHRAHLWEFDLHDLADMLYVKKEAQVSINAMPFANSPLTGEPLGWWVVTYRVTPENRGAVGKIDMERKLWCQRPRQTVSASLIAGAGCRETVLWCLNSIEHLADEVIIVDCGLTEVDKLVINSSAVADKIQLVPGVDPKKHGFETPRNIGLRHCKMDWVLWIDTDEKMLRPQALTKYLRPNCFDGYSIRQHHFAVDTHFDPDLPVRLFRNTGKMQFFGMIHEHPEFELNKGPGRTIVLNDAHIAHVGYLLEDGRKERFSRNLPMLMADIKKHPDRVLQKHFIMRDNILLCSYELQQNGGRITDAIRSRALEVVELWRKYFKGRSHVSNVDPISYYSQANQLLGQGFDAVISISADKLDAKPQPHVKIRFADQADYLSEVERRAKEAAAPFQIPYY